MTPLKVAICCPNEGYTSFEAYDNHLTFAYHLGAFGEKNKDKFEFYWGQVGRVLTPLARERLCEFSMELGADLIMMYDNDMILPRDLFESLYDTMVKHKADIVSPLAFMRVAPHYPVIFRIKEGYDAMAHKPWFEREIVKNYPKDAVVECEATGFGAVLIKMDLIRKMKKPWFMSTSSAGEDVWFCHCAKKEQNAKIVMDTRIKLGHLGTMPIIDEKTYEEFNNIKTLRLQNGDAPRELCQSKA